MLIKRTIFIALLGLFGLPQAQAIILCHREVAAYLEVV